MLMRLLWQIKCRKQSYLEQLLSWLLISRISVSQQQNLVSCQILNLYHLVFPSRSLFYLLCHSYCCPLNMPVYYHFDVFGREPDSD